MENFELVQELKLELIRGYEEYVRTLAGLTGSEEDAAREAIHSAICRMLIGLKRRPPGNPIVAWRPYIIRAVINELRKQRNEKKRAVLFSELDKEGREDLLAIPDPGPTPAEQAEKSELATLAWQEVGKLPRCEREVIARRCNGFSFQEIARAFSIECSTATGYWTRGIETLRARFRGAA